MKKGPEKGQIKEVLKKKVEIQAVSGVSLRCVPPYHPHPLVPPTQPHCWQSHGDTESPFLPCPLGRPPKA